MEEYMEDNMDTICQGFELAPSYRAFHNDYCEEGNYYIPYSYEEYVKFIQQLKKSNKKFYYELSSFDRACLAVIIMTYFGKPGINTVSNYTSGHACLVVDYVNDETEIVINMGGRRFPHAELRAILAEN
jgi:hypothetical protein